LADAGRVVDGVPDQGCAEVRQGIDTNETGTIYLLHTPASMRPVGASIAWLFESPRDDDKIRVFPEGCMSDARSRIPTTLARVEGSRYFASYTDFPERGCPAPIMSIHHSIIELAAFVRPHSTHSARLRHNSYLCRTSVLRALRIGPISCFFGGG
jgi:hypothetical protein